ncbi:MAG: CHC2 zinc finger domain-containing protein [Acidobacteriia bacterium]|nr:CHC2 zinc finger domain-containing protein [Terriglobia bacterium]
MAFFKLAKDPQDRTDALKMLATPGSNVELYGWEHISEKHDEIIICEGEFDRLVLESRGFAAVTSTGGAGTFRKEWADAFKGIPKVYVCFDNDEAGRKGAERIARMLPQAGILQLPEDVGDGGDVTDFFVRLVKGKHDFRKLMDTAQPLPKVIEVEPEESVRPRKGSSKNAEPLRIKSLVRIEDIIRQYVPLSRKWLNYLGHCPFHDDRNPSFVVYPQTQSFYCFGCDEHGDVLSFIMRIEQLTFPEALEVLRQHTR